MNQNSSKRMNYRVGLTLIELLVVLTILIALGGIVVSSLPGLLGRTQAATAAANVPEIDSAIRRRLIMANGDIGNRFDSLLTGASGINGEVASYIGGAEYFQSITLSESDVSALAGIGITELIPATPVSIDSETDSTFDSHLQAAQAIGTDSRVCSVASAFSTEIMERIWNLTPPVDARYLVFGLGSRSTLVGGSEGALFPESPVHFSDEAASGPTAMYSRYLIVVELRSAAEKPSQARYVGVAIPCREALRGVSDELKEVYSSNNPDNNKN